ncbi:MAG: DUF262 domain-containing protein [Selenomonadaceae bacterium]|nr:DUF262 domain-containing protein [Selenomonadaceae bacterium]
MSKYTVINYTVETILTYIKQDEIVVPEIQRPFVWKSSQVRDLIDSLYNEYPTGYLIIWQNPNVRLKNGGSAVGKKILIDGQQRVTALMTAIVAKSILTENYEEKTIKIAFNPTATGDNEKFAVQTSAHIRSSSWLEDISELFKQTFSQRRFINKYLQDNPDADEDKVEAAIEKLINIKNSQLGVIVLDSNLDIDAVTEIFVRINSQGKRLNASDFAMSKIAADKSNGGNLLRKVIDYFCRLSIDATFYKTLEGSDSEFMNSEYVAKTAWVKSFSQSIYKPDYVDMLRVSFMKAFRRGKLKDLVSLLSGRDFVKRTFDSSIIEDSFKKLRAGVENFINEYNFRQFVLAIQSAGFIHGDLLTSKMTLDFAYTLYLLLHDDANIPKTEVKRLVQKWFVLSTLTGRYIASPESQMDRDLREIASKGFKRFFDENEAALLSETFWEVRLVQNFETTSTTSPYFLVYLAAQVFSADKALFSNSVKVSDLILSGGDIHHIFPKEYLKSNGITDRQRYNQIANYTYLDKPVNIVIGKKSPQEYFGEIAALKNYPQNLEENSVPPSVVTQTYEDYEDFLLNRRRLMADKVKRYYRKL